VRSYKLLRPVFGGTGSRGVGASYRVSRAATVTVVVRRGSRVVRRCKARRATPGRTYRLSLSAKGLRRGDYTFALTAVSGKTTLRSNLVTRRL